MLHDFIVTVEIRVTIIHYYDRKFKIVNDAVTLCIPNASKIFNRRVQILRLEESFVRAKCSLTRQKDMASIQNRRVYLVSIFPCQRLVDPS